MTLTTAQRRVGEAIRDGSQPRWSITGDTGRIGGCIRFRASTLNVLVDAGLVMWDRALGKYVLTPAGRTEFPVRTR